MTDSPFLPETKIQFAWDATSLEMFKACPRLYYYSLICGYQKVGENVHLKFGILYHEALQNYDLSRAAGIKHDDAVHDVVRALLQDSDDWWSEEELLAMRGSAKNKTREALVRTVVWHLEKFKDDPAKTFIKQDGKPAVEQSFRFELDWGPQSKPEYHYLLCGHLDKIVQFSDEFYVMDYKTSIYEPTTWFFEKFEPHNQMTMYSLAAQIVLQAPVKGVIISAVQVKPPTKERDGVSIFGRGMTSRTDAQLKEWVEDLNYWFTLAEQCAIADRWPQNDTSCDRYGGCKFRDVCSKSPQVRERFLESDFIQLPEEERWNPLKSR